MQFIKEHSSLPVPRVFAYEFDEKNSVGAAFILMEVLPGSVAMDALGGYEAHRGVIPNQHRQDFYRSVAKCHLTSLRLPKIGAIIRTHEGKYELGPLPGLGGPFDTATAFLEAWADSVKFKWDKETITHMMQRGPITAEQMLAIIENFPSQIKSIASQLSLCDEGPFPLAHDDFLHSNIMVDDKNFDVTGIIDWGGACTAPIELLAFPEFLTAMPISFDLPQKYDQDGQPFDEELRELWRERGEYIEMVKSAELSDSLLSKCLGSKRAQAIAYSYGAYTCVGKLGFYDRVMRFLKREEESLDN
ncbi:Aminoglycoside phosphotransferase [Penicillium griseofulvum]|uniref:Aminoglycoside phosphotransferase n=1 Tax=Penicillium patulum TaxID=5078 RepID=A0A135LD21_PENPA|nr:Aminoglycoside phosphotransferase [Penicillium griseofulvum]KXG46864.1 Aminoglycoside phosphotransferase [Penicillium griseofulvum]